MNVKNLKLIARTEEDLRVVSAHLQDAIVNISDIANLEKNKIFLLQLNRFMWEDVEKGVFRKNKRIRSIVKFENVIKVLSNAPGCKVVDERRDGGYITPLEAEGDYTTYISRIRKDNSNVKAINMWVVSDNLLKGAALNTVQIAEHLVKKL